jgi:hypothetical protein
VIGSVSGTVYLGSSPGLAAKEKLINGNPEFDRGTFDAKFEKMVNLCFNNIVPYYPAGIRTQIDKNLNSISLITPTPTWNKLKLIAKYNDLLG